ncbi:MAG: hypothetical protein OXO52_01470 [Rhodospirillales bacterium]|nr:hypothetical protein [Rhodospirillales bacterium]
MTTEPMTPSGAGARPAIAAPKRTGMAWIVRGVCAAAVAAIVIVGALPAEAHRCDRTDNDRAEASRAIRVLTGEIDAMERAIIEALRLQTGQLSGYTAQSTKAITQALDAQTRLQAQTAREVEETRTMNAHRPSRSACSTVTGVTGLSATRSAAETMGRAAAEVETGRIASDRAVVAEAGSAADGAARFDTLTGVYCSPRRAGDETCWGEDEWHGADLKPGTLLDRRTFGDETELHAAVELSRNLAAPVVHDPLPMASAETDRERRLVLLARAADARTALAADWFGHARSLRTPGADLGVWADAVSGGRGQNTGKPVSRYELMELLASRRFDDPGWFVALQEMSAENLLRELVMLQSIDLMLDWERFRLDERRGALEAARLALATEEMRRLPGLTDPGAAPR